MSLIREPAVAGLFYPANSRVLHQSISDFLDHATSTGKVPKAIIVPHAGYQYSGEVAANAYHLLKQAADKIRRVILIGPSHHVGFSGVAVPSVDHFATPLGNVPIDKNTIALISDLSFVQIRDDAHYQEHSLEVQLPFLQTLLSDFSLVPIVVGDASAEEISHVLERLWNGPETLIVVSSDLSHFYNYITAKQMDRETSEAIEQLRPDLIGYESACGRVPVNGLLTVARKLGLSAHALDLRNSGDTAGSKDRVVGYGAYEFY
jgi:AmmeMemoRadiSam system protein B